MNGSTPLMEALSTAATPRSTLLITTDPLTCFFKPPGGKSIVKAHIPLKSGCGALVC